MLQQTANIGAKSLKKEIYRKAVHISSLWIPLFIYLFPQRQSVVFLGILLTLNLMTEYFCYKKLPWARQFYEKLIIKTLRGREICKKHFVPSGAVYVLIAAFISVLLFSKQIAVIALSVMLISDACAAVFGKMFGRHRFHASKTLEGTIMFFVSAVAVTAACSMPTGIGSAGFAACIAATLCELYDDKIKIDDNLSVPLVIGLILTYA